MKRDKRSAGNPYGIPKHEEISVKSFGTGEAAEILDIPIWRLRNFWTAPRIKSRRTIKSAKVRDREGYLAARGCIG